MSAIHADHALGRGTMLMLGAVGILAFVAMLVLGAYAPDLRSGRNGGTHALSNAATGFSGLVQLAEATGRHPVIVRNKRQFATENLIVVSPDTDTAPMDPILSDRGSRVTLVVLPKWQTEPDPDAPGWVRVGGLIDVRVPHGVLAPGWKLAIARHKSARERLTVSGPALSPDIGLIAPRITQTISGPDLVPVLTDASGRILLGQIGQRPLYVLADPDLIDNHGLRDPAQAAAALRLLDQLNSTDADGVMFDVTANGLSHSRSPLRLAFDPPFLAVTLTLFVAMLLAGWQTLVRFGAPRPAQRALAFGKTALVDNSAALIRRARRESRLGGRYADVVRRRASALLGLAPGLDAEARDARLDALVGRAPFSDLAASAVRARTRPELVTASQDLNKWMKELQQ